MRKMIYMMILLVAGLVAVYMPVLFKQTTNYDDMKVSSSQELQVRHVEGVTYVMPDHLLYETIVFTEEQLLRGKMLLLDEDHPLPKNVLPPNTASIAKYGNGMVPICDLDTKSGRNTIDALKGLFSALRDKGINGIYVYRGTTTVSEQYSRLVTDMRMHMRMFYLEDAREMVLNKGEMPGAGELLQEYTVELRLINSVSRQLDERSLEETPEGQALLQYAWRYGFVRSDPEWPYRFRYVGKAHATAMTYLDLDLADYLDWLHLKQVIAISSGNKLQYLILCQPMKKERIAFEIPDGASYEASYDNTGYAIAACTL